MKKHQIILCLLSMIVISHISCEKDNGSFDKLEHSSTNADLEIIAALGFDNSNIIITDSDYIVEGDIILSKNQIKDYLNNSFQCAITRQAQSASLVSSGNVKNIRVKIDPSLYNLSNWRKAILQAIDEYNNVGSLVYFKEVSSNYDILIKADTGLGENTLGQGSWPSQNKPGNLVKINTSYNHLFLSQKKLLIVHELGHNLGLRHTNWKGQNESTGIGIPGTPNIGDNPDPQSVMNGSTGGHFWKGFSNYDIIALKVLYNACQIFGSDVVCDHEEQIYTLTNTPPNAIVTWHYSDLYSGLSLGTYTGNPHKLMTSPHTDTKLLLIATVTLPDGYTYEAAGRILDLYNSSNPGAYITTEDYVEFSLANHDNNGASDYHWEVSDGIVYLQGYDNTLIEFSGQRNIYTIVCYYKNRCGKKVTISATVSPRKAIW